jgi:hypothetical protein
MQFGLGSNIIHKEIFMKVLISIKWIENWEVMSMKHELGSSSSSSSIEKRFYGNLITIKWIENWKISMKHGWGSRSIEKKWKFEHHIEWIAWLVEKLHVATCPRQLKVSFVTILFNKIDQNNCKWHF